MLVLVLNSSVPAVREQWRRAGGRTVIAGGKKGERSTDRQI